MKNLTNILLSTFLLAAFSMTAQGQPPGPGGGALTFEVLDGDGDGNVTFEEFTLVFREGGGTEFPDPNDLFGRWDLDGDKILTSEEFTERPARPTGG